MVRDNTLELIVQKPRSGLFIYDSTNLEDITHAVLGSNYQAQDLISEDFNGDLLPDLYLTRRGLSNSGFVTPDDHSLNLNLQADKNQQGITFETNEEITIDLFTFGFGFEEIDPEEIYIGESGLTPVELNLPLATEDNTITRLKLTLNPEDDRVAGLASFTPGED